MCKDEDFSRYNGIGTQLADCQKRLLDIMVEVDKVCRNHDIPYWLDSGSLLGAVRHNGFIPWDDDIDICVFYKDHKKLCKLLKKELPDRFVLQNHVSDPNYYNVYSKVVDTKSKVTNVNGVFNKRKYQGLSVDIFTVEPGNINLKRFVDFFYGRAFEKIHNPRLKRKTVVMGWFIWLPCVILISGIRLFYSIIKQNNYILSYGIPYFSKRNLTTIVPLSFISFEKQYFQCPGDSHSYLTSIYGDYLQIPPENKRIIRSGLIEIWD